MSNYESLYNTISNLNTNTNNRFDNYNYDFNYDDMVGVLDDVYGKNRASINRSANTARNNATNAAKKSLAARGITSGSVVEDTMSKAVDSINTDTFDTLEQLGINNEANKISLMNTANQNQFAADSQASSVDLANISNMLQKLGLQSNTLTNWENNKLAQANQSNGWDDLFGILNTGANVATAGMIGGDNSIFSKLGIV